MTKAQIEILKYRIYLGERIYYFDKEKHKEVYLRNNEVYLEDSKKSLNFNKVEPYRFKLVSAIF